MYAAVAREGKARRVSVSRDSARKQFAPSRLNRPLALLRQSGNHVISSNQSTGRALFDRLLDICRDLQPHRKHPFSVLTAVPQAFADVSAPGPRPSSQSTRIPGLNSPQFAREFRRISASRNSGEIRKFVCSSFANACRRSIIPRRLARSRIPRVPLTRGPNDSATLRPSASSIRTASALTSTAN